MSAADPLSSVLDDVVRLDKILSTDGGVLIIDQICLVIPAPRRFPDDEEYRVSFKEIESAPWFLSSSIKLELQ